MWVEVNTITIYPIQFLTHTENISLNRGSISFHETWWHFLPDYSNNHCINIPFLCPCLKTSCKKIQCAFKLFCYAFSLCSVTWILDCVALKTVHLVSFETKVIFSLLYKLYFAISMYCHLIFWISSHYFMYVLLISCCMLKIASWRFAQNLYNIALLNFDIVIDFEVQK